MQERKAAVKTMKYFQATRVRLDREKIKDEWIKCVVQHPEIEHIQPDGLIRRWAKIIIRDVSRLTGQPGPEQTLMFAP